MRTTRFLALVFAVLLLSTMAAFGQDRPADFPDFVPGEVLLKFKAGAAPEQIDLVVGELGIISGKNLGRRSPRLKKIQGLTVPEAVARFRNHAAVEYIEPNFILSIDAIPDDPRFSQLWGLRNIGQGGGLPGADIGAVPTWDTISDSPGVLVCVIDSGLDYLHEDLEANVWTNPGEIAGNGLDDDGNGFIDDIHGYDFVEGNGDPYDQHGHGTHVAGTIAAVGNNGIGVTGVSWRGSIMAARFLGPDGLGTTENAIAAIEYAVAMGAKILNNSWGGPSYSEALEEAVSAAGQAGVLVVASAGNTRLNVDELPRYPGSLPNANIICVGASDRFDSLVNELLWGSNYGAVSVDLLAPGLDIFSTLPGDEYGAMSGTSMAAPLVSGALALMFQQLPDLDAPAAKKRLLEKVEVLPGLAGACLTSGRLDLYAAVGETDLVPPAKINDLAAIEVGGDRVDLTWTAVGDDGLLGMAVGYDLRYAEFSLDETNWDEATAVTGLILPGSPGSLESMRVTGLDFQTTYYFGVTARDEFGNDGALSNLVTVPMLGAPSVAISPSSLVETLLTGATVDRIVGLQNTGSGPLDFQILEPLLVPPSVEENLSKSMGGPDGDGYIWSDSDTPGGPIYEWVDALDGGSVAMFGDDEALSNPFPIGFAFPFYGKEFTEFQVSSNGFISFPDLVTGDPAPINSGLPSPGAPGNLLAPYWDDLDLSLGGAVFFRLASDRLIIQYEFVTRAGGGGLNSFQVQLFPDGVVKFLYRTIDAPADQCTVGIQNADGSAGLQVVFDAPYLHDGLAVRFMELPRWIQVSPRAGSIEEGGNLDLTISLNADLLCGFEFAAIVPILSNDPLNPRLELPVGLLVEGEADLSLAPGSLEFGRIFINQAVQRELKVINSGCELLTISDIRGGGALITVVPSNFDLEPDQSRIVLVTYDPPGVDILAETLIIESNDPDEPQQVVQLSGQAVIPPGIVFGSGVLSDSLLTGQTSDLVLSLGNSGGSELVLVASGNQSWWTVSSDTVRVPAGETASLPVRLDASGLCTQSLNGLLTIASNDPVEPALNIPVELRVTGARDLVLPVSPLDFGEPLVGASVSLPLEIFNEGCDTLRVSGLSCDHPDFLFAEESFLLAPGSGRGLTITFHPAGPGPVAAVLTINSDDPDEPAAPVPLVGEGLPAPQIVVQPLSLAASAVPGQTLERVLTVANTGDSDLFLYPSVPDASWVTVIPDSVAIPAGDSVQLALTLDAMELCAEYVTTTVFLDSNDPDEPRLEVPLALVISDAPDIHLPVTSLDFGPVFPGQTIDRILVIEQLGCLPLSVARITSSSVNFSVADHSAIVEPGQTLSLAVSFESSVEGPQNGILTILSSDPDEPEILVAVSGMGLDPPVLEVTATGMSTNLFTGETSTGTLVLRNSGSSDLLFSISTEAVGASGLAMDQAGAPVVARGRPVDLAQLPALALAADGEIPARIILPEEAALDADSPGLKQAIQARFALPMAGEEVFGDLSTEFVGDYRTRGNLFRCDTSTTLREHRLYLDAPSATQMWFLVYEGMEQSGTYDLISASDLSPAGPASGWFSSGQIDVPIAAGRFYLAVASFASVCSYFADLDIPVYPVPTSFGSLLLGAGYDWSPGTSFPPRAKQLVSDSFGSPVAYYQTVITGEGTAWMDVQFRGGTIPAGAQIELPVVFDAAGRCETYFAAEIMIHSNDPSQPLAVVSAEMTVQPAGNIEPSSQSLDFGASYPGFPVQRTLVIGNSGCEILTVSPQVAGGDEFMISAGSMEIPPEGSVELVSTFLPTGTGVFKGTITLSSDDPDEPWHLIPLMGESRPMPRIRTTPEAMADTVAWGEISTHILTVENIGGSDLEFQIVMAPNLDQISNGDDPATQGLGSILVMETDTGEHYFQQALKNLGLPHTAVPAYNQLAEILAPVARWDLIIITNYGDYPSRYILDELAGYVSGGGSLIFSDWAIQDFYWHALITRLGAEFQDSLEQPDDFAAFDPAHGLFSFPNEIQSLSWTDNQGVVDGQLILPLAGSTTLAEFAGHPGYAAILQNEGRNGLLNAFQPANFNTDEDGDGRLDMVELCENEILYMAHRLNWLTVDPGQGLIPAGGSLPVNVTFNGSEITGGWLEAELRLLSNVPGQAELRVPVVMGLEGVSSVGDDSDLPRVFALDANVPNPFNPVTAIFFDLPRATFVQLKIFDVRGLLVRTLIDEERLAGRHSVVWNGRDAQDRTVASGVYFYRIDTENFQATRRMVLLK